jgi:osmotically-inducible protein OsmY
MRQYRIAVLVGSLRRESSTDAELQVDVCAQLDWEPLLGSARIGVSVHDRVVSLAGQVDTRTERWAAERAAERVAGVRAVVSEICVVLPAASRRSDANIERSAQHMLQWLTSLPPDCVQVVVDHGWITLSGRVDWAYQKQAAAAAIRYVIGAAGVTDRVAIGGRSVPAATRPQIDAVLNWRAAVDPPSPLGHAPDIGPVAAAALGG